MWRARPGSGVWPGLVLALGLELDLRLPDFRSRLRRLQERKLRPLRLLLRPRQRLRALGLLQCQPRLSWMGKRLSQRR